MSRRISVKKGLCIKLTILFWVILVISGCNIQQSNRMYYLLLMGESENWNLEGYEIVITPEEFSAGYGTLTLKNEAEYITDSFRFDTHVVIDGEDIVVHSGSSTGGMDISEETTGAFEGENYLNEKGDPITLNDISDIYMVVEWQDNSKDKSVKEKIDLYKKSNKEKTFF